MENQSRSQMATAPQQQVDDGSPEVQTPPPMASTAFQEIRTILCQLYLEDDRPWLVGFSGGKDSTCVASLVFEAVLSVPPEPPATPINVQMSRKRA